MISRAGFFKLLGLGALAAKAAPAKAADPVGAVYYAKNATLTYADTATSGGCVAVSFPSADVRVSGTIVLAPYEAPVWITTSAGQPRTLSFLVGKDEWLVGSWVVTRWLIERTPGDMPAVSFEAVCVAGCTLEAAPRGIEVTRLSYLGLERRAGPSEFWTTTTLAN